MGEWKGDAGRLGLGWVDGSTISTQPHAVLVAVSGEFGYFFVFFTNVKCELLLRIWIFLFGDYRSEGDVFEVELKDSARLVEVESNLMIGRHGEGPRAPPTLSTPLMGGENHPPPCAASWHAGGTHPDCPDSP